MQLSKGKLQFVIDRMRECKAKEEAALAEVLALPPDLPLGEWATRTGAILCHYGLQDHVPRRYRPNTENTVISRKSDNRRFGPENGVGNKPYGGLESPCKDQSRRTEDPKN